MKCPGPEILFELAQGQLPNKEQERVLAHIEKCDSCRQLLKNEISLDVGLKAFWKQLRNKCPDIKVLYEYLSGNLSASQHKELTNHIELCSHCKGMVQDTRAIWNELGELCEEVIKLQPDELKRPRYLDRACYIAKVFISDNLPEILDSFDTLWRIVCSAFESTNKQKVNKIKHSRKQFAVALAAVGMPEIEFTVASLVTLVTLRVCKKYPDQFSFSEKEKIKSEIISEAKTVGLSKVMGKRLAESILKHLQNPQKNQD
jgi:hypothetical protein